VTILDSYEAVGAVLAGAMDEATLAHLERSCLPTVGACAGQFTANTMAMVSEALGLSLPNVSMIPGPYDERAGFARQAGAILMRAVANGGPRPRDIVTRKALENACAVVAAQDDNRAARPSHASLRNHRNRQRELALQTPRLSTTPACPGGQTGTSQRAASSLVRALRDARGTLLFATGTSLPQRR
jgi:hypothetical protein